MTWAYGLDVKATAARDDGHGNLGQVLPLDRSAACPAVACAISCPSTVGSPASLRVSGRMPV
jgi:hypothetical protein